jgi:hypothetical protein
VLGRRAGLVNPPISGETGRTGARPGRVRQPGAAHLRPPAAHLRLGTLGEEAVCMGNIRAPTEHRSAARLRYRGPPGLIMTAVGQTRASANSRRFRARRERAA